MATMALSIHKIRKFSDERDNKEFSIVRLSNKHIKYFGKRHNWVKIINKDNNMTIYRRIRGGGNNRIPDDGIEIDYDSKLDLGCEMESQSDKNGFYPCNLAISKVGIIGASMAHWHHPNIEYRVPYRISMVSFVLGVIGFLMGIISLL